MLLNLTDQETDFLLEVLETTHSTLIHDLNHTDTQEYKELLRQKIAVLEGLKAKIPQQGMAPPPNR